MGNRLRVLASALVLTLGMASCAVAVKDNLPSPRPWDFYVFWVSSKAVALGGSPYDSGDLLRAADGLSYPVDFRTEVIEPGSPYPPTSLALFAPLGRLPIDTAAVVWYAIHLASLCGLILLLQRAGFSPVDRLGFGLAACAGLVLASRATAQTLSFAQSHFALLTAALLAWRTRDRFQGGLWIALATAIKPIGVALLAFPFFRGDRRSGFGFLAGIVTLLGAACLAMGTDATVGYFVDSPVARQSLTVMAQSINQSLSAVMLRHLSLDLDGRPPYLHPLYLVIVGGMFLTTAWAVYRGRRSDGFVELSLMVAFAIIAYPGSLEHYGTHLLLAITALWRERARVPGGASAVIAIAAGLTGMPYLRGDAGFCAAVFAWICLAWLSLARDSQCRSVDPTHAARMAGIS